MRTLVRFKIAAILAATLGLVAACASAPIQGYSGAALPAGQTAVVEKGAYADVLAVDGVPVRGNQSVSVLPGKHTVELRPTWALSQADFYSGAYYFWSRVNGSLTFNAEPGHTYAASVRFMTAPGPAETSGSGFVWTGQVEDQTAQKQVVARTANLPLEAEPRVYPTADTRTSSLRIVR